MQIPFYQVDAFTRQVFRGNPAGVCLLESWLDDSTMQAIARENNLPETAFLVGGAGRYEIRWFSPLVEIDLCGHATLAAASVIFTSVNPDLATVQFFSPRSGKLAVARNNDLFTLDFPAQPPVACVMPDKLLAGLGRRPAAVLQSADYLAVFENEAAIRALQPDIETLKGLDLRGVIVTAPGESVDFVSRFFAPKVGINEDPVTGSAHCALIPYWKSRLNKTSFHALQLSDRGGELFCADHGGRVAISGAAACFLQGSISI